MKLELKNNSITFPQKVVLEYHLQNEVEVDLQKDGLFIKATKTPRENWANFFTKGYSVADEQVEKLNVVNESDETEWTW